MLNKDVVDQVKKQDVFYHFKSVIDTDMLNWLDTVRFFRQEFITNVELIGKNGKIEIPKIGPFQDKQFIINNISNDCSFVISNFTNINNKVYDLYEEFKLYYQEKNVNFHLYAGLTSKSYVFPAHNDLASNYIIQIDGECEWTIYKEKATYDDAYNYKQIPESELTVSYNSIVKPGDILYIPSGKYHRCIPLGKRLSISVPIL
jgi:ribosomal protein L16 Arg81 hydroxylase